MAYGWRNQLAVGAAGEARVADWLETQGWLVADMTDDRDEQRRDVDFLLYRDGHAYTAEVKTDTHAPKAMFVELAVDNKPGYIFKTRAEVLLYCFPEHDLVYWLEVPALLRYLYQQGSRFDVKVVTSRNGKRTWQAEGIVVPLTELVACGAAKEHRLLG
jgi:Holliday junction resolvase-like predicted endonuclease